MVSASEQEDHEEQLQEAPLSAGKGPIADDDGAAEGLTSIAPDEREGKESR